MLLPDAAHLSKCCAMFVRVYIHVWYTVLVYESGMNANEGMISRYSRMQEVLMIYCAMGECSNAGLALWDTCLFKCCMHFML